MFKKVGIVVCSLVALFLVAGVVLAAEEAATEVASTEEAISVPVAAEVTPAVVEAPVNAGNMVCPVTGMKIDEMGKYTVEYQGKVYNLCSETCKEAFLKDPDTYVSKVNDELAAQESATEEAAPAETK